MNEDQAKNNTVVPDKKAEGVLVSESKKTEPLLKKLPKSDMKKNLGIILTSIIVVLAGIGTGWLMSGGLSANEAEPDMVTSEGAKKSKSEAGIEIKDDTLDTAEGILNEGGLNGEGTHRLDRGFGPQKDAYLTSTVINLDDFVGKKVKVWGETNDAQKAGWFMDVLRIKEID
jgi:hypothetical protein